MMEQKPIIVISCPIDTVSGYGSRSRDIVRSILELDKYDVRILPQMWGMTAWGFLKDDVEWHKQIKNRIIEQLTEKPDVWIQITVPNEFQPVGHFNVGITAGIETTQPNHTWIEGLNRMDLNLVSSNFSKEILEKSIYNMLNEQKQVIGQLKVEKPIQTLFEGVDFDIYGKTRGNFLLKNIPEKFNFLFVGHWLQGDIGHDRKNVGMMIKVFLEVFKDKANAPGLILKTSHATPSHIDKEQLIEKIEKIKTTVKAKVLPNIYVIHGELTDEEMNDLYFDPKVKAMISFTRGEGFGRPLAEFATTKKPIIASNWSGHLDFLKGEHGNILIGGEVKDVHPSAFAKDIILKGAKWFEIDYQDAGNALLSVFSDYKLYEGPTKNRKKFIQENFSRDKMREELAAILEQNAKAQPRFVQPQLPKLQLPKLKKLN